LVEDASSNLKLLIFKSSIKFRRVVKANYLKLKALFYTFVDALDDGVIIFYRKAYGVDAYVYLLKRVEQKGKLSVGYLGLCDENRLGDLNRILEIGESPCETVTGVNKV
jgi:hypothetical protein